MKEYMFKISPLNTEKLINSLIKKFGIYNITKTQNECTFYCKYKNKKQIEKIIKFYGITILNAEAVGKIKHLKTITSWGLISGIVVSCGLWIVSLFFVTNVVVLGNINLTHSQIMQVVKNHNINNLTAKSNINLKQLEQDILNIKYVSYASAIIKGNALVINIKEQLTNKEVISIGSYEPLISNFDGKITSLKLIQGTPAKNVGDIVKIGDVLVYPYIKKSNGEELSVQPIADIVCDVWQTAVLEVKDIIYKKVRTGNVIKSYNINAFGVSIFEKNNKNTYKNYEKEEKTQYLTKMLIPIKINFTNYYECQNIKIETNFEQNKQKYIEQTRRMSLLNIQEYDIIKDESYSLTKENDINIVRYTVTISKKIC